MCWLVCCILLASAPAAASSLGPCRLARLLGLQVSELPLDPRLGAALLATLTLTLAAAALTCLSVPAG